MDAERLREYLLRLPHVTETMQWGANLVYWAAEKSIGGKMFALIDLNERQDPRKVFPVFSFYAGPERFGELLENDGVAPAPYLARAHWVAMERWDALGTATLERLLTEAHRGTLERLPARTRMILALPKPERAKVIAARKAAIEHAAAAKQQTGRKAAAKQRKRG